MKQLFIRATLVATFVALTSSWVLAQAPPGGVPAPAPARPAGPPPTVAVIDMLTVFEKHAGFQERKNMLQKERDRVSAEIQDMRDQLKAMADKVKEYKPGSNEYNNLEAEYIKMEADAKVKVGIQQKEFIQREGKMYYQTYQEVLDEVKWYCERANIHVVLRYSGNAVNPDDPQDIMQEMNEQIVYFAPPVDITQVILNQLNSRPRQQQPPTRPAAGPPAQALRPTGPVGPPRTTK